MAHLAERPEVREVIKVLFNVSLIGQLLRDEATTCSTLTTAHLRHHLLEHIEIEEAVIELPDRLLKIFGIFEEFTALGLVSSGWQTNEELSH